MINRSDDRLNIIDLTLLVLLGAFLFLVAFQKQRWDTDIFWALKSGEWIVENMKVPATDPFSYTFAGREWIDFTWGFQLIAHLFYTYLGGWYGLFILQLILTGATFFVLYRVLRLLSGGRTWLAVFLVYMVFVISHGRFFIRPHLFAYLFISLYFLLLTLYEKGYGWKYLASLLPLQVLWVNIHSSFVMGIFIVVAYAAGAFFSELRRRGLRADVSGELKAFVILSVLLPLVSLINPYGWKLVVFPLIHQGGENAEALRYIGEWTRIGLRELLFFLYPFPLNFFAFKVLTFATVAVMVKNYRGLRLRDLILFAAAFYMAASHVRWVALFAYFAAPVMASNAAGYLDGRWSGNGAWKRLGYAASVILSLVMICDFLFVKDLRNYGVGLKKGVYPEGTVRFIERQGIKGKIYNAYIFGGYLAYHDISPFIDGRTPTVYSPYFFWTTRLAERKAASWKRLVEEYGIDMVLVKTRNKFCKEIFKDDGWSAVAFDDVSALFLRKHEGFKEVLSSWEIRSLNPCGDSSRFELPEDDGELMNAGADLKRLISFFSESGLGERVARPHRLLGLVYTKLGGDRLAEAVEELNHAISIKEDPYTYYDLGLALGRLKRYDDALAAFEQAVHKKKKFYKGYMGAGLLYYDTGDYANAVEHLETYIDETGDETEYMAYRTMGLSCFRLERYDCAIRYLKRAAFTGDDPGELAEIYYHLGSAAIEAGAFKEAVRYYRRSVEAEPEYREVLRALYHDLQRSGRNEASLAVKDVIE